MKILRIAKKKLAILGITLNQSLESHPFNRKISMGSFIFGFSIFSHFAFLLHLADTFMEYTESVYMTCTTISIAVSFLSTIFQMRKSFEIIVGLEKIVKMSKWTSNKSLTKFQYELYFNYIWNKTIFRIGISNLKSHLWWN